MSDTDKQKGFSITAVHRLAEAAGMTQAASWLLRPCIVTLLCVALYNVPAACEAGGRHGDARRVLLGRKAAALVRLRAGARLGPATLLRLNKHLYEGELLQGANGGRHTQGSGHDDNNVARAPPPTPPTRLSLGSHAAEYFHVAAAARSALVSVAYDFTAQPSTPGLEDDHADDTATSSPPPPTPSPPPLRIAQYSHVYGRSGVWSGNFTGCDRPCEAVGDYGDAAAAAGADVVVVNLMQPATPWARPPGQVWVGTYFESPDHYPSLRDARILSQFNYTSGYRPDADFPIFNMVRDTAKWLNDTLAWPLPSFEAKAARPALATWISNCVLDGVGRLPLLAGLAEHNVSIASYGRCGPNRAKPEIGPDMDPRWRDWAARKGRGAEKAAVSAQHLFLYAAENSGCAYYTTEKVFHGLVAGSVPIYVGDASSLKKLAPPGSVIYAADFEDAASLAAYLRHLATNRTAYDRHLAWRTQPASMQALRQHMSLPAWEAGNAGSRACALCEFLWAAPRRVSPAPARDLCRALFLKRKKRRLV